MPSVAAGEREGFDELSVGEWVGFARARGVTEASDQGGRLVIDGGFSVDMNIIVPVGRGVSGDWELDGDSEWTIETSAGVLQASATHSASGAISGSPSAFSLGFADLHSEITGIPGVTSTVDTIGPLDLGVTSIYCDDAQGEWILSWNLALAGQGYTPTFEGDWNAIRMPEEFSEERRDEIRPEFVDIQRRIDAIREPTSTVDGIPIFPVDVLWDLLGDVVAFQNELRNLEPCDRAYFGDDDIERWRYTLTEIAAGLGRLLIDNLAVAGEHLSDTEFTQLAHLLTAAGAVGPASTLDDGGELQNSLGSQVETVVADPSVSRQEKLNVVAAAATIGVLPDGFDASSISEGSE